MSSSPMDLIDYQGVFVLDKEPLVELYATSNEESVSVISILGSKGSGKSTLLNELFGCSFETSKRYKPRPQTCRRIQASIPSSEILATTKRVIVALDFPGLDGRVESEWILSKRAATFAVGFSDIVIVNLWCADIGRQDASGLNVLPSLFYESTKIFTPEDIRKTLLLFVIRDHDDASPIDTLRNVIESDVENLWQSADKIEAFRDKPLTTLFDIMVVSLPHFRHRKIEFDGDIASIRARLLNEQPPNGESLLRPEYSKFVQIPTFAELAGVLWSSTGGDAELNVPARADLVASYRCDMAFEKHNFDATKQLVRWVSIVDSGQIIPGFGKKATQLLTETLEGYDADTQSCVSAPVRTARRNTLSAMLQEGLKMLFNKQIKQLQNEVMTNFKSRMLAAVTEDGVSQRDERNALNEADTKFVNKAEDLLIAVLRVSYRAARLELQNSMNEYAARMMNSPAVQLHALEQMERQSHGPPPKQRGWGWGLSLSGAMRPRGYGNFQVLTGYSKGPHVVNFTVCNDADAAEQEGQGKVPFFRLQPTLNVDVDI